MNSSPLKSFDIRSRVEYNVRHDALLKRILHFGTFIAFCQAQITAPTLRLKSGKNMNPKILIIDDDEDVLLAAKMLLKQSYPLIHTERDPERLPLLLQNENYDLILLDMNFTKDVSSGKEGFYWLDQILKIDAGAVVIFITAFGDTEKAVCAIKDGAVDFVLKPWQNEKLLATVSAALKLRSSRLDARRLRQQRRFIDSDIDRRFDEILGQSAAMQQVFLTIEKVAETEANVLILGENGTGKELIARALHRKSKRAQEIFLSVDMGAISENLFESELFGHEKGAFTGADSRREGRFEAASGGTIFLDEIGNLPLNLQAKLLAVLQNRHISRLGSNQSLAVDIRLICATNMSIDKMVQEKMFRQDLLYRINTVEIHLPPLRERFDDIPLLLDFFLQKYAQKYHKNIRGIAAIALKKLQKYTWPGNIRELQHAIERAVILSESENLQPDDFSFNMQSGKASFHFDNFNLEAVEKIMIQKALQKYKGNITHAADELGLTRAALYRRLQKHNL